MAAVTDSNTTILLDVYERLGAIETKLEHGTEVHGELKRVLEHLSSRMDTVEIEAKASREFRGRVGYTITLASGIVMGALYFLWEGLKYFSADIRAVIGRLFQ